MALIVTEPQSHDAKDMTGTSTCVQCQGTVSLCTDVVVSSLRVDECTFIVAG